MNSLEQRIWEKERIRRTEYVNSINNNTSIFKFIPDNIGRIEWCDTTNPKAVPNEHSSKIAMILSKKFKGIDYFVGTEGFAEIHFEGTRDNITKKSIYRFDSFSELISIRTKIVLNYVDQGTSWNLSLFNHPDEKGYAIEVLNYHKELLPGTSLFPIDIVFLQVIEKAWIRYKYHLLQNQYKKQGRITFNQVLFLGSDGLDNKWVVRPYVTITSNHFEVFGNRYDSSNLKKLIYKDDHIYLATTTDSIWNKIGLIKRNSIWVTSIGSSELFLIIFDAASDCFSEDKTFYI